MFAITREKYCRTNNSQNKTFEVVSKQCEGLVSNIREDWSSDRDFLGERASKSRNSSGKTYRAAAVAVACH